MMEKNVLLTIEYDGSDFFGWQRQPDRPTVQGHLEKILSSVFKREIVLNGTSRTDAGVHALGQRASFKTDLNIPTEKIPLVVNNALSGRERGPFAISPVKIVSAEEKPLDFHARFDAKGKKYIYKIRNCSETDLFLRNYVYHVDKPLDLRSMRRAAEYVKGVHDFKSFEASGGTPRQTTVRTVFDLQILVAGESEDKKDSSRHGTPCCDMEIHVSGDGFLYNMVRIITGTLVEVGLGKLEAESIQEILEAKDRTLAGHTAPPYGLYLAEVYYEALM